MMANYRYEDLSKQKFFNLQPIEYIRGTRPHTGPRKKSYWLCLCDCGDTIKVRSDVLKSGNIKDCGCCSITTQGIEKYHRKLPIGSFQKRRAYFECRIRAKRKNQEFSLSYEDAMRLFISNCHYCGLGPSNVSKIPYNDHHFLYSGIDRINSSSGYVPGNCVPCCKRCNIAKNDMGYNEFLDLVTRIYANRVSSNMAAD